VWVCNAILWFYMTLSSQYKIWQVPLSIFGSIGQHLSSLRVNPIDIFIEENILLDLDRFFFQIRVFVCPKPNRFYCR